MDTRGWPQQLPYRYVGVNAHQSSKVWMALGLLFAHHAAYIIKLLDKISNPLLLHANMNCGLCPRGREKPGALCSPEGHRSDLWKQDTLIMFLFLTRVHHRVWGKQVGARKLEGAAPSPWEPQLCHPQAPWSRWVSLPCLRHQRHRSGAA